jgi:hypothetical protein
MDQEQDDRRPTDTDVPYKKKRLNRPQLTPLINPNGAMNGLPANQVNQRMVNGYEEQANNMEEEQQQQQAGRRKRHSKRRSRKSRKSRKSRRYRR